MNRLYPSIQRTDRILLLAALLAGLFILSRSNYLLFHTIAELFSVIIACTLFILAWNSRDYLRNGYLLFIGISGLFIGGMDLVHSLAYKGLGVFPGDTANLATQLWLAARFLQAGSFLMAPLFLVRRLRSGWAFLGFSTVFAALLLAIFRWKIFPDAYVEGNGLTAFKIGSEIAIILAYGVSILLLYRFRRSFDATILRLLVAAILVSAAAEAAFTGYTDVYGLVNLAGHFLKILAFYLLYVAIIQTGIVRPNLVFFRELKQSEEALRRSQGELESEVLERTRELQTANAGLLAENQERQRAEQALGEQRMLLETVLEQVANAIILRDRDGRVTFANPEARKLFDIPLEPGSNQPLDKQVDFYTTRGDKIPPSEWLMARALQGETTVGIELRLVRRDGSYSDVIASATPLINNDGSQNGAVLVAADITPQRAAEEALRRANQELEERVASRTAALELSNRELQEFAYVASHDLQEPLRKIIAFGDRLARSAADRLNEHERDYLDRMQRASERMRAMIDDLLSLSRITTRALPYTAVDLNSVASEVISDLEVLIEQTGARVEIAELPVIHADPVQMRQLLQNLIGNALKFTRPGNPPEVKVYAEPDGTKGGVPQVNILVSDNGIGFEEQYVERIFQPFQRLHGIGVYEGSGIGLSIVQKIVQRHGGSITARSQPGQGSTFIVTLPAQ